MGWCAYAYVSLVLSFVFLLLVLSILHLSHKLLHTQTRTQAEEHRKYQLAFLFLILAQTSTRGIYFILWPFYAHTCEPELTPNTFHWIDVTHTFIHTQERQDTENMPAVEHTLTFINMNTVSNLCVFQGLGSLPPCFFLLAFSVLVYTLSDTLVSDRTKQSDTGLLTHSYAYCLSVCLSAVIYHVVLLHGGYRQRVRLFLLLFVLVLLVLLVVFTELGAWLSAPYVDSSSASSPSAFHQVMSSYSVYIVSSSSLIMAMMFVVYATLSYTHVQLIIEKTQRAIQTNRDGKHSSTQTTPRNQQQQQKQQHQQQPSSTTVPLSSPLPSSTLTHSNPLSVHRYSPRPIVPSVTYHTPAISIITPQPKQPSATNNPQHPPQSAIPSRLLMGRGLSYEPDHVYMSFSQSPPQSSAASDHSPSISSSLSPPNFVPISQVLREDNRHEHQGTEEYETRPLNHERQEGEEPHTRAERIENHHSHSGEEDANPLSTAAHDDSIYHGDQHHDHPSHQESQAPISSQRKMLNAASFPIVDYPASLPVVVPSCLASSSSLSSTTSLPAVTSPINPMRRLAIIACICTACLFLRSALLLVMFLAVDSQNAYVTALYFILSEIIPITLMLRVLDTRPGTDTDTHTQHTDDEHSNNGSTNPVTPQYSMPLRAGSFPTANSQVTRHSVSPPQADHQTGEGGGEYRRME